MTGTTKTTTRTSKTPTARATRVPAGAPTPTDRKSAARKIPERKPVAQQRDQVAEAFDEPVTVEIDGLEVTVSIEGVDDIEFIESLAVMDQGGPMAAIAAFTALRRLVGEEQYDAVKEHYRDPDTGRAPASAVADFFWALFEELNHPNS